MILNPKEATANIYKSLVQNSCILKLTDAEKGVLSVDGKPAAIVDFSTGTIRLYRSRIKVHIRDFSGVDPAYTYLIKRKEKGWSLRYITQSGNPIETICTNKPYGYCSVLQQSYLNNPNYKLGKFVIN